MNYQKRVETLQKLITEKQLDAVLISSWANIVYLTGYSNFSVVEREAFLFITKNNAYIITDGRYSEAVARAVPHFELVERTAKNPLTTILKEIKEKEQIQTVGFEDINITVSEFLALKKVVNLTSFAGISTLRVVKSNDEIQAIRKACELGDKAFEYIITKIKKAISEQELAYKLEQFIKKHQATLSFDTIIAFSEDAAIPHHQTGDKKLEENSFVLLDFGVKLDNYCSDMTRTVFFGKANKKQRKMYNAVKGAQQEAINYVSEQLNKEDLLIGKQVDKVAKDFIVKQNLVPYSHGLGHGVGVEVHEAPRLSEVSKDSLTNGMVFSIEPGIYISSYGGVRIEDIAAIVDNKLELLTNSSKDLIEIE